MMRFPALFVAVPLFLLLFPNGFAFAQGQKPSGERIVFCMIRLEHADAEQLAAVLQPLLSPEGSIAPYRPTNTLIIRDRASIVDQLAIAIKGIPCATEPILK
ncbi:MAG: secretin N-terminal domain-containing protein [Deltaproteobacteria bacterium]|jgi:type II secretory pathway component GspD/PulD (secretin)